MNNLDKQYTDLLQDILDNGVAKQDRTGTGTISVFGRQIRHKMSEGFPLLTTKKMYWKGIVTELLWFLRGDTNIKFLVDNNCHIWDGDAYKNFINKNQNINLNLEINKDIVIVEGPIYNATSRLLTQEEFINKIKTNDEFAKEWGELGPIYGKQWREWTYLTREQKEDIDGIDEEICGADMWDGIRHYRTFDQISNSINLLKTDPDSRRNKVSAWNVGELDEMTLPPCHTDFQFYTRELSLEERVKLFSKNVDGEHLMKYADSDGLDVWNEILNKHNIPTRAISLMWNQRSVDTFLGFPFNVASYGLLLEIIAKEVNMVPDELIGNLGDTHLYLNHIEQAKEQIGRNLTLDERIDHWFHTNKPNRDVVDHFDTFGDAQKIMYLDKANVPSRSREPFTLPELKHMKTDEFYKSLSEDLSLFTHLDNTDFTIENYQSHPHIKAPLSN
jgi:thymidylate synthase